MPKALNNSNSGCVHIPAEIAGLILSYMQTHDIAAASAVNRVFYTASGDEEVWQRRLRDDWLDSANGSSTTSTTFLPTDNTSSDSSLAHSEEELHHLHSSSKTEYMKRWRELEIWMRKANARSSNIFMILLLAVFAIVRLFLRYVQLFTVYCKERSLKFN